MTTTWRPDRPFLHPLVQQTVVDAYAELAATHRARTWQYREMGKAEGGPGAPARVSFSVLNKYGDGLDFAIPARLRRPLRCR